EIVATDMGNGLVLRGRPYAAGATLETLAHVPHPCHAEAVDLDRDGRRDLVVADLGDFAPADELLGAVVWLRATGGGAFESRLLASGLPRVADVEPADLDGDGDTDLAVAAFGWRTVG